MNRPTGRTDVPQKAAADCGTVPGKEHKMKNCLKIGIALLVVFSMLLPSLAACGENTAGTAGADPSPSPSQGSAEEVPAETGEKRIWADDVPDDAKFGGQTVKFMWWAENREFAEEYTGEVVNDAAYERELSTEARLNVDIVNVGESYTWDTKDLYLDKIRSSVMAHDGAYDVASGQYATLPGLVADKVFANLKNLNYLDFSKPYWVQQLIEETSVDGKLFLATGDLSQITINQVWCVMGNDTMRANLGLDNPVELVHEGRWTKDAMNTMITGVYADTDGNQAKSGGDTFGLVIGDANCTYPFLNAWEISYTTLNEEGYPELTFYNDKTVAAWEQMMAWCFDSQDVAYGGDGNVYFNAGNAFIEGRTLFDISQFSNVKACVEHMDDSYILLPMPKWDEEQAGYHTWLGESNTLFGILTSAADMNATAAALEVMAAESYRLVSPAIYEINMKTRYSADQEMSRMFDLIRSGVVFNFGLVYGFAMNYLNVFWKGTINSNGNLSSAWKSQEKSYQAAIDKFFAAVKELD